MVTTSDIDQRIASRIATEKKVCNGPCGRELPLSDFYIRIRLKPSGKKHISVRESCKSCHNSATVEGRRRRPSNEAFFRYRRNASMKGLEFALSLGDVRGVLSRPCDYCGETELLMTIDRANNDLGYVQSNVVPACIRCNVLKGDMPLRAWLEIAPSIRSARNKDLFGKWIGRRFRVGKQDITK